MLQKTNVSVNLGDIEHFKSVSAQMKTTTNKNLPEALGKLNELLEDIRDKSNKTEKAISEASKSIKGLDITITALTAKIAELGATLAEKEATLACTPKSSPIAGVLALEIATLLAKIKKLTETKKECETCKENLKTQKKRLEEIKLQLRKAENLITKIKPQINKHNVKIFDNSKEAENTLSKAIEALNRYLNVREPFENAVDYRKSIVNNVNIGNEPLRVDGRLSTKRIGNYGEMRTSIEMQNNDFYELTKSPMSIDEKLSHGIDHIFYKNDEYYIGDSKSGHGAHLEPMTATGPQLSDTWIDARLDQAVGKDVADIIREKMIFEPNSVKRFVSKVNVGESTLYEAIDNNGKIIKEGADLNDLFK